jgi:uncharacterized protein GlcG (DUF336 family)
MTSLFVTKQTISLRAAQKMVDKALEHAQKMGKSVSVAVVDDGGFLIAFGRLDTANPSSVNIAIDKAYTAATTRLPTHQWQKIMEEDQPLRIGAPAGVDRLIVFGGGQPIVREGNCIGAIGVSGAHWTGDTEIGAQALQMLEELATGEER